MTVCARLAAILAVLLALAFGSSFAPLGADAEPYTAAASVSVNQSNPCRGGPVTLTGVGYVPGSRVVLTVGSTVIGRAPVDAAGDFSVTLTLPDSLTGARTITAAGPSGGRMATTEITIKACGNGGTDPGGSGAAGAGGHDAGGLSTTGVAIYSLLVLAVGLIVGGLVLVRGGRRRRAVTPA